ncbi:TonB-dependent receptor plug domain-containing protein [Polaribacter litorisediminis]|uniref:TonB-dependent receptor plug domain-containing protein n=1 Tax=Polaribacter litorisediminis TaxID=1908341 RepID=UPI001CC01B5C|nr:TonB-dependent receptor plug domain-containing protein [Polaribacter litorisediminis]UAM97037.1 TonB-dependent receptor plug domain-containing protein [Polaribacter litorisediminis]
MKSIKTLFFLLAVVFSVNIFSQKKSTKNETTKLTILVKDGNNKPIPGAVILFDNVKQKRVANASGYFKIKLKKAPKEISAFSSLIGVKTITYKGEDSIVIKIRRNNDDYFEDTSDEKIASAIQFRDIYDYLRGKVSGVNISTSNSITIRGNSTFSGGRGPLLILNGVQIDESSFAQIVPTTIRSVKILKGPEAAIYGVRGANGVIEVVTAIN